MFNKISVSGVVNNASRAYNSRFSQLPADERQYWIAKAWDWVNKDERRKKFILSYPAHYGQKLVESLAWCFKVKYDNWVEWCNVADETRLAWDL